MAIPEHLRKKKEDEPTVDDKPDARDDSGRYVASEPEESIPPVEEPEQDNRQATGETPSGEEDTGPEMATAEDDSEGSPEDPRDAQIRELEAVNKRLQAQTIKLRRKVNNLQNRRQIGHT